MMSKPDQKRITLPELFCAVGIELGDFFFDVSKKSDPTGNPNINALGGFSAIIGDTLQETMAIKKGRPLYPKENQTLAPRYLFGGGKKELTQSAKGSVFHELFSIFERRGITPSTRLHASKLPTETELTKVPRGHLPFHHTYFSYLPSIAPLDMALKLKGDIRKKTSLVLKTVKEGKVFALRRPSLQRAQISICLEGLAHLSKKAATLPAVGKISPELSQELILTMIYGATRIPPLVPEEKLFLHIHEKEPVQ